MPQTSQKFPYLVGAIDCHLRHTKVARETPLTVVINRLLARAWESVKAGHAPEKVKQRP